MLTFLINVELANMIIMNLFYDWSVHMKLLVVTAHLELTHRKIISIHVYCHSNMQTCEWVWTKAFQYCFGLVRPHQQITTQQNHEISDSLLLNPGQYFLQTYRHVLCMCVCACMWVCACMRVCSVYVCVHDQVCLDVCASWERKGGRETAWLCEAHTFNLIPRCKRG